jgi:putative ABC transport system substrate-binding protein
VGAIYLSGHHQVIVDGLRQGLRDLGLEEGKHYVLDVREVTGGDWPAVGQAARDIERANVEVIYAVTTQVALGAKRATAKVPIVFYVGVDPVAAGLVQSFAKPGGRLSGVHSLSRDLTVKRMEILKEMIPKLRRMVTFYDSRESISTENAQLARKVAQQMGLQLVERHLDSVEETRGVLQGMTSGGGQAYFHTPGGTATSQAPLIIDAARTKKLPTMFTTPASWCSGAWQPTATTIARSAGCRPSTSSESWRAFSRRTFRSRTTTRSVSRSTSALRARSDSRSRNRFAFERTS